MIYIDPPYNTGNDSFIYPDKFSESKEEYLKRIGDKDEEGYLTKEGFFKKNSKENGQFHSNWLSMMYPRLFLARNLLRDDGVIFVSIDDNEVHNLRLMMNEVFGEENLVAQVEWQKRYTRSNNTEGFTSVIDHIVIYRKTQEFEPYLLERNEEADARYKNPDNDPRGPWKLIPFSNPLSPEQRPNLAYKIQHPVTKEMIIPEKKAWRSSKEVFERYVSENRVWWGSDGKGKTPGIKRFLSEVKQGMTPINFWDHEFAGHTDLANREMNELFGDKVFDTPKPTLLIQRMLELATSASDEDIVLDFFAGSGTTGDAVLRKNANDGGNRRFLCVQFQEPIPEDVPAAKAGYKTIADICRDRIHHALKRLREEFEKNPGLFPDRNLDLGLKSFMLQSSCFKVWRTDTIEDETDLKHQLDAFGDPSRARSEAENMAWEILLKMGYELTTKLKKTNLGGIAVYSIADGEVLLALEETKQDAIDTIAKRKPKRVIFLDRLFEGDDQLKTNTALQMKDAGVEFVTI
jgi:adenine-specific DNA-methyltransferase